jgi:hypothetical protein
MKVSNNTISNLGILPDLEIPKNSSAEVTVEQMNLASKSPVVAAWFKEGHLSFEDEAAALAEKEAADKEAADKKAADDAALKSAGTNGK